MQDRFESFESGMQPSEGKRSNSNYEEPSAKKAKALLEDSSPSRKRKADELAREEKKAVNLFSTITQKGSNPAISIYRV